MFYEKPTSSRGVFKAASAYNWRAKLTTLSMETFRRMRNSSRQLNLWVRAKILRTFIDKVRGSGYSRKTCDGVLESGLRHYYCKVRVDLEGGPRLNHRCEKDAIMKKRVKMGVNHNWFTRRR